MAYRPEEESGRNLFPTAVEDMYQGESPRYQPFYDGLNRLRTVLGGDNIPWVLSNGGAIHFYGLLIGKERFPTDIDITVLDTDLARVSDTMRRSGVPVIDMPDPVRKWGFEYSEPQLKLSLSGYEVDVLNASKIALLDGTQTLTADFEDVEFRKKFRFVNGISVVPMEYLFLVKAFQHRANPKTDVSDLKLILKIAHNGGQDFDYNFYEHMRSNWVNPSPRPLNRPVPNLSQPTKRG